MSTRPRTQTAFVQGKKSTVGQDASHSALFYLFQEVSKLESPIHSFMDIDSPSMPQDYFTVERKENDTHLFRHFSQSPNKHAINVQDDSHVSSITAVTHPECNSPLKVLTLINLQCERLLHPEESSSLPSISVSGPSGASSSTTTFVTGVGVECDSQNFTVTLEPLIDKRREITAFVSNGKYVKEDQTQEVGGCKPECPGNDAKRICKVKPQTTENTETHRPEQMEEKSEGSSQPPHEDKTEAKFSVGEKLKWNIEQEKDSLIIFPEDALSETHLSKVSCINHQLTFNVSEDASEAKPALLLDHNANLSLTTNLCDAVLKCSTSESFSSLCQKNDRTAASSPKFEHASAEEISISASQLKPVETVTTPSATVTLEPKPVQKEDSAPCSQQCPTWRTKTPRKQPRPSRSANIQDPDFQGVMFRMDTEVDDSTEQCRLLITSKYSKELPRSVRKPRVRTRSAQKSLKTTSSDEESDQATSVSKGKVCASCCTQKTPMWRDAEDGTPLCNACGIRYKKYRVRCVNCWHIPRKEGNSNSRCLRCGNFVRLTSAQRKRTT